MNCPACKVAPGQHHETGCDVEVCPECGGQLISCGCISRTGCAPWHEKWFDRLIPWTGKWPGVAETMEFGWYCRRNPDGPGYLSCDPDHPQALPDLNRLCTEARWDAKKQRYVLPEENP
jgi:hypothetical protein